MLKKTEQRNNEEIVHCFSPQQDLEEIVLWT